MLEMFTRHEEVDDDDDGRCTATVVDELFIDHTLYYSITSHSDTCGSDEYE